MYCPNCGAKIECQCHEERQSNWKVVLGAIAMILGLALLFFGMLELAS